MKEFIRLLHNQSRVLYYTGLIHFVLAIVFLLLMGVDARNVQLESVWLKPFRFAISISLFTWTYAWFTGFIQKHTRMIGVLNRLIATCMFIEIILISMQSVRGVDSHFNVSTPFDATVFSIMGGVIGFNAIVVAIWFVVFSLFEKGGVEYRSAIVWGMFLFLLGNFSGYLLTRYGWPSTEAETAQHMVLTDWKMNLKDLRISHALGLHAIQVLPFFQYVIGRFRISSFFLHVAGIVYGISYVLAVIYCLTF
ncbi:MAG: hypothetical protein KF687_12100 [Cyclobacteriaceae bacterium]|nr:hypothetical protein [Cyclobacteriaceae bacterium]